MLPAMHDIPTCLELQHVGFVPCMERLLPELNQAHSATGTRLPTSSISPFGPIAYARPSGCLVVRVAAMAMY